MYFGWNFAWLKYFTYRLVPALSPKTHFVAVKVRKVCYSLAELYVKCVF
jgi:hypothetical protein